MANNPPLNNGAPQWNRGFRGMQVHAVPDSDKAFDAQGRRLPWAYSVDPSAIGNVAGLGTEPVEKGPFGRSQRRARSTLSRSRSKTAEPSSKDERVKAEQVAAEDAVFGSLRRKETESGRGGREILSEVEANAVAGAQQVGTSGQENAKGEVDATEVMLYGFGEELQWAALDHYERVSGGTVLEDYDRQPPGGRYDAARSFSKASQRSLTRAALKKKNTFAGGLHWIKITFDSREAAELACVRSPHVIKGYLVYAEPYLGRGPGKDEAIVASAQAGAQITDSVLPTSFSTNTLHPSQNSPGGSSTTLSSATATTAQPRHLPHSQSTPSLPSAFDDSPSSSTTIQPQTSDLAQQPHEPTLPATIRRRRISGVKSVTLLPVDAALMPKKPKQSWAAWLGAGEVIGSTVPRRDDGSFDYEKAGLWWRMWWWVDWVCGTDWCGVKAD